MFLRPLRLEDDMNPAVVLALISNLYEQLIAAQERIRELEKQKEPK